jgi:hypothetical protein
MGWRRACPEWHDLRDTAQQHDGVEDRPDRRHSDHLRFADFTTRARDEMFTILTAYQALKKRVDDLTDEVTANGGAAGLYGAAGVNFPAQSDGFDYDDMVAAFQSITAMIGAPTAAQKNALWKSRR